MSTTCLPLRAARFAASVAFLALALSGCVQLATVGAHDSAVQGFPNFAETRGAWGPIPPGHGRVVMFYPRVPTIGTVISGSLCGNPLGLKVDESPGPVIGDQLFVFVDLPAGRHTFYYRGLIAGPGPTDVDIQAGQIAYLRVGGKVTPMAEADAAPLLAQVRHLYRKPLPYNRQEKSAETVKW
jgi:hypothetical protein